MPKSQEMSSKNSLIDLVNNKKRKFELNIFGLITFLYKFGGIWVGMSLVREILVYILYTKKMV